jgi:hypothetical protein
VASVSAVLCLLPSLHHFSGATSEQFWSLIRR